MNKLYFSADVVQQLEREENDSEGEFHIEDE